MSSKKQISAGKVKIGGGAEISIQSMCSVPFIRFDELANQIKELISEGCEIIRVSVPDKDSAEKIYWLKNMFEIPIVADIHYDYTLALASISAGADKIRINPGNIQSDKLIYIAREAKLKNIPIRVGINSGSLEKDILSKYKAPTARALAESADRNVKLLQKYSFDDICVSIKSSDVRTMINSYRIYNTEYNNCYYPLHLGVTEAGTLKTGTIKSSIGIGSLLSDNIGDTIRVSLSANPVEEVKTAKIILKSLGLRKSGIEVISCPTCGRTTIDSISLANRIEEAFDYIKTPIKIAVMGCPVNGIGEAKEADFGVTGVNGKYILFIKDKIIKNISESEIFGAVREEIEKIVKSSSRK